MHPLMLLSLSIFALAVQVATYDLKSSQVRLQSCEGEKPDLHCYNGEGDRPQNVNVDDIAHVAKALRDYGHETDGGRFLTMTAANAPNCAEWTLFKFQTVLVLAKHTDTHTDSSLLFEDIATTIDGGENASDEDRKRAIVGCETSGGAQGAWFNVTNPSYHSDGYKNAGYSPSGILVKIVANFEHFDL